MLKVESRRMPIIWWWWSTSKCKSKGASTWLTHLGLCASATGAALMLSNSSEKWEITERGFAKVFGRKKEDWKNPAQVYRWYTCYRCILC